MLQCSEKKRDEVKDSKIKVRYGGKEKDNEIKGDGNSLEISK